MNNYSFVRKMYKEFSYYRKIEVSSFFLLSIFLLFTNIGISQTAPYLPSSVIIGIKFNLSTVNERAPGSDNWAITWADDDHQYATWGDGGGFGGTNNDGRVSLGVARIEGSKNYYQGYNVWGGKDSENSAQFEGKSVGIISISGNLWMWRSGNSSNKSAYYLQELYKSTDHGATWKFQGVKFTPSDFNPSFPRFYAITFCQFGQDYKGARDDYIYMYAPETYNINWNVQIPGQIILIRVLKTQLNNKSAYEYFSGIDNNGNPTWSPNIKDRVPVFEDVNNGVMRTSVSYNVGLRRYFLITQQVSRFKNENGYIGIYDAPEPWGPWTTVLFENPWSIGLQNGSKTVFWNFSNKWLSNDGKDFVLVYTGRGSDEWGTVEGSFLISPQDTINYPNFPTNLKITK